MNLYPVEKGRLKEGRSPHTQPRIAVYLATAKPRYPGVAATQERQRIVALIANDAYACTFQSMGQYRSALMKAIHAGT